MTDDAQRARTESPQRDMRAFLAERRKRVTEILTEAHRLSATGSGAMYAEDEARMLAQATLDLLIRYLELDHAG